MAVGVLEKNIGTKYITLNSHYKMIGSSVMDLSWVNAIDYSGEQVLIIAEGLLMYLNGNEVKKLFVSLKDKFYDAEIIFDAFSIEDLKIKLEDIFE